MAPGQAPPSSKPEAEARFKAISQAYELALHESEGRTMFGMFNGGAEGGGGTNRSRSTPPPSPGSASKFRSEEAVSRKREPKDVHYTATSPRPGFSSYSGTSRWKPPAVERKLECTLEELFRGCKKEISFTRDVVVNGVVVQMEETQTIKVKPGWKKGTTITFEGMGDEHPGCIPADVVFLDRGEGACPLQTSRQ
ncbi:hypothetical protein HPP92_000093 [Vanilla planifolia]|uniref:Chaperone DnaJ C-terminal domain-containing protein n=1 Tax=Vanilla planifolia TaxID=51239 RepID=A0A835S0L8_VANPL|nr:hypothetical protein HPP92_000093 [Vanilla planifolia]